MSRVEFRNVACTMLTRKECAHARTSYKIGSRQENGYLLANGRHCHWIDGLSINT